MDKLITRSRDTSSIIQENPGSFHCRTIVRHSHENVIASKIRSFPHCGGRFRMGVVPPPQSSPTRVEEAPFPLSVVPVATDMNDCEGTAFI
jgi:hypothetical protein